MSTPYTYSLYVDSPLERYTKGLGNLSLSYLKGILIYVFRPNATLQLYHVVHKLYIINSISRV